MGARERAGGPLKGGVSAAEVEQVLELEAERKEKRYGFGWVYHRAAERRLILAYEHTLGSYRDGSAREHGPQRGRALRDPDPLLRVELVPETCFYKSVRQKVVERSGQEGWDEIRLAAAESAGGRCEACLGRGRRYAVACHGTFEYDDYEGVQILTGFLCLCPACTEVRHIGLSFVNGRYDKAFRRLMMVNRWTEDETVAYLDRAWAVHERRSVVHWRQDMSLAFGEPAAGAHYMESRPDKEARG